MAGDVGEGMNHKTGIIETDEQTFVLDDDGHLADPNTWTRAFAEQLASNDGRVLSEDQWWLIEWVRDYWRSYGNAPLMRSVVVAYRAYKQDPSLGSASIYDLFTDNPVREACRLGGVPKPDWCI